jgi:hypothetical protein
MNESKHENVFYSMARGDGFFHKKERLGKKCRYTVQSNSRIFIINQPIISK